MLHGRWLPCSQSCPHKKRTELLIIDIAEVKTRTLFSFVWVLRRRRRGSTFAQQLHTKTLYWCLFVFPRCSQHLQHRCPERPFSTSTTTGKTHAHPETSFQPIERTFLLARITLRYLYKSPITTLSSLLQPVIDGRKRSKGKTPNAN